MPTSQIEAYLATLSGLLGKALIRCIIERSSFEGETTAGEANRVALEFTDSQSVTLDLAGDGQSLAVVPVFALAKEWSDWPYGSVHETYSVKGRTSGAEIKSVRCLIEAFGKAEFLAGVWVTCEGGFQVGFYNFGDSGYLTFESTVPELDDGMTRRVIELEL